MALYGIMVLSTLMNRNRMSTSIYWQVCSKGTITKPSLMGISMHLHDILVRGQRLIVLFKFLALKMSKVVDGRLWKKNSHTTQTPYIPLHHHVINRPI